MIQVPDAVLTALTNAFGIARETLKYITSLFPKTGGMERPVTHLAPIKESCDAFFDGYTKENPCDDFWLRNRDLFIRYRRMLLFTAVQDGLQTKPEIRESWKRMILEPPVITGKLDLHIPSPRIK